MIICFLDHFLDTPEIHIFVVCHLLKVQNFLGPVLHFY